MSVLTLAILNLARKKTIESFKTFLEGNPDQILKDNLYTMAYMIILLLVTTIPAVLVATNCNKDKKAMYGIIAFLFSDILRVILLFSFPGITLFLLKIF